MHTTRIGPVLAGATVAWFTAITPASSARLYEIVPLDPPAGYSVFYPNAINSTGQVVGTAVNQDSGTERAAVWRGRSTAELVMPADGLRSAGTGINDAGLVVGEWEPASTESEIHAVVWDGEVMRDLGLQGRESGATGINAAGSVVGYERDSIGNAHAMLWEAGAGHRLDRFEVGFSNAVAINDNGQVVLTAYTSGAGGSPDSYLSAHAGALVWLGAFEATAFNNSGHVVGYRASPLPDLWGLLWQDGAPGPAGTQEHPLLPLGINDRGQVIGSTLTAAGTQHAVMWEDGVQTDLNDAIAAGSEWALWRATSINSAGQIVGDGLMNGTPRGFMLTPWTAGS